MNRRNVLTSAGLAAMAGVFVGVVNGQDKEATSKMLSHMNKAHAACLEACQHCAAMCNQTLSHCMNRLAQGDKAHAACAAMAMGCQEFCSMSAQLIARSSPLVSLACDACSKACDACALECEKMATDDHMVRCAKECRECAVSCRSMAA